ncbi:MAG TPA: hypothetical protein VGL25_13885 [Casimicrobiaceae bacterium]|jgi:hypothetical protein
MSDPGNPDTFEFEKVSLSDARKALDDAVKPAVTVTKTAANHESKRKAAPPESLRTTTIQWILKLPPQIQPRHLQVKYPRVANRIAALWGDPTGCESYLDDLLTDKRGGRKGFPLNVAQEIASIRDYYFRLNHKGGAAWEHVEWS